jgi:two-component system, sensor histidine kinase PdtaS
MTGLFSLSFFKSVRGRLLAIMAFIIIPLGALSLVLAWANYQTVVRSIELSQIQTVSNFAVRSRIWFRGSLRTLLTTVLSTQATRDGTVPCETILRETLAGLQGFQAIHIMYPGAADCHASINPDVTAVELNDLAASQKTLPYIQQWIGPSLGLVRYDAVRIKGTLHLLVFAKNPDPLGRQWEAILLTDPALLDQAFEAGSVEGTTDVALMTRGNKIVVARNVDETDASWLPTEERAVSAISRWEDTSTDGTRHIFASQIVAEPDLYVLTRSDKGALNAARTQLLILTLTPLLTLAILFMTYARVIQSNIVGWISGIEQAALSRQQDPEGTVLAPLDPTMPQDIRSVAEAFNGMVESARKREFDLRDLVASNQFLVRELHHRVKNSLQVIQSYLALSRRQQSGAKSLHLAETEAKVQVLSTAYRLGLTERGMVPVSIRAFAEELVGTLSNSMRQPGQWINTDITGDHTLIVDRIIPLGLALVESIVTALVADNVASVAVHVSTASDGAVLFRVTTTGKVAGNAPSAKIMAGLAAQLGAVEHQRNQGDVLNWTFRL